MDGREDDAPRAVGPAVLRSWRELVRGHRETFDWLETALRAGTYWLPGRFAESDLGAETLLSTVNLFSLANDALAEPDPPAGMRPEHVSAEQANSAARRRAWQLLRAVQTFEAAAEIGAERVGGERGRLRVVNALEATKAAIRLQIVALRHSALIHPPADGADEQPGDSTSPLAEPLSEMQRRVGTAVRMHVGGSTAEVAPTREGALLVGRWPRSPLADLADTADPEPRAPNGEAHPAHEAEGARADGAARSHSAAAREPAPAQRDGFAADGVDGDDAGSRLLLAGELLWVLRPLVYTALLSVCARPQPGARATARGAADARARRTARARAWLPWLVALGLDLLAALCTALAARRAQQRARARVCMRLAWEEAVGAAGSARSEPAERSGAERCELTGPAPKPGASDARAVGAASAVAQAPAEAPPGWQPEIRRRRALLALYLLRPPVLNALTAPPVRMLGRCAHARVRACMRALREALRQPWASRRLGVGARARRAPCPRAHATAGARRTPPVHAGSWSTCHSAGRSRPTCSTWWTCASTATSTRRAHDEAGGGVLRLSSATRRSICFESDRGSLVCDIAVGTAAVRARWSSTTSRCPCRTVVYTLI